MILSKSDEYDPENLSDDITKIFNSMKIEDVVQVGPLQHALQADSHHSSMYTQCMVFIYSTLRPRKSKSEMNICVGHACRQ